MSKADSKKIDISIIIPNYNSTEFLLKCLHAIYEQTTDCGYEIIIVDSSEIDPSAKIKEQFPDVNLIHYKERTYPGTARNYGVRKASGEILAFTDADCIPDSDWLDRIYKAHQTKAQIIAGSIKNGYSNNLIATAEYFSEFGEFLPNRNPGITSMFPSCNFTMRRDTFNRVGGFKGLITSEDVFFSNEIRQAGFEIYFNPEISITHFNRRKISVYLLKQKELGIGSYFMRKRIAVKGSWLTNKRIYTIIIPFLKTVTIVKKTIQNDRRHLFKIFFVYPFILLGLFAYCYGFWISFKMNQNLN